jgi:hypothetical protein
VSFRELLETIFAGMVSIGIMSSIYFMFFCVFIFRQHAKKVYNHVVKVAPKRRARRT